LRTHVTQTQTVRRALPAGALLFWFAASASFALAQGSTVTVARVLDGDSVILADGVEVRLIGINAPEFNKSGPPHPPLAEQARQRLRELVLHKQVVLVTERERRDRYGRTLAHLVLTDGTDVEDVMAREGLAWVIAIPPNVDRLGHLQAAEAKSRAAGRGVWAENSYRQRPASTLGTGDTGFQLIEGVVSRVGQSAHAIYLDLAPQLTVVIPRDDWQRWFHGNPADWRGRHVEARGWITARDGRLRLRVRHPAMLKFADTH